MRPEAESKVEFCLTSEGIFFFWKYVLFAPIALGLLLVSFSLAVHIFKTWGSGSIYDEANIWKLLGAVIAAIVFFLLFIRFKRMLVGKDGIILGNRTLPYSSIKDVSVLTLRENILILNANGKRYFTLLPFEYDDYLKRLELKRKGFG
jgi:uncharacterized membrane protein YobD (UPF0266 family)